ncbi:MAG: TlpA disulfide reductase family protein [Candidatus Paceibacterota bacterium]
MIYLKRILIGVGVVVLIFFVLKIAGSFFIKGIVQEVSVKTYGTESVSADLNKEAPFFELADLNGNIVKLSDFSGAPLVVLFWTTWNAQAADQIKILDDYLAKNSKALFRVVAVNNQEDRSAVSNFIKRGGYQLSVLLDEKGATGELYRARNLPASYFLDKNGVIKDIFVGVLNEKALVDKSEKIIR